MTPSELHGTYQRETGLALTLTLPRADLWALFASRFTEADLVLVLRHLKKGIQNQERHPGCLKLSNLIWDLDKFEEDLCLARALSRRPQTSARDRALAELRPTTTTTTASADAKPVGHYIEELRKAIS